MRVKKWIAKNINSMEGKTVLITGANSGIGFECARICASKGASIIFACRSLMRAEMAINKLKQEIPAAETNIIAYDQSSFKSINQFVCEIRNKFKKIDVTIINAGIYHPAPLQVTEDNLPLTIGVNYFGALYMISNLLPFLETNKDGKIIIVSSLTYRFAKYKDYSFLTSEDKNTSKSYGLSKLAITKLFVYLSEKSKIKVYQMHPGISSTNIFSSTNNNFPKWFQKLAHMFLPLFTHSPEKACLGIVDLAANNYENGTYLGPRGFLGIYGYPIRKKIPKKIYKDVNQFIDYSNAIIDEILKEND